MTKDERRFTSQMLCARLRSMLRSYPGAHRQERTPSLLRNNGSLRTKLPDSSKSRGDRQPPLKAPVGRSGSRSHRKAQRSSLNPQRRFSDHHNGGGIGLRPSLDSALWSVLNLKKKNYFSCSVGRARTAPVTLSDRPTTSSRSRRGQLKQLC
ncbi:hypothetical protein Nepgr_026741 [Nepenthes gracilis]|uniref:Uncharacterized protein n=1 Tax=Nepenthes gracilis TaxID=150966 RepID=A0AAD3Y0U7_NEPGR|nr:hypothetical protein Nepgr_026741 [Nepenthes gracilis]